MSVLTENKAQSLSTWLHTWLIFPNKTIQVQSEGSQLQYPGRALIEEQIVLFRGESTEEIRER